jgi:hypothetical protein
MVKSKKKRRFAKRYSHVKLQCNRIICSKSCLNQTWSRTLNNNSLLLIMLQQAIRIFVTMKFCFTQYFCFGICGAAFRATVGVRCYIEVIVYLQKYRTKNLLQTCMCVRAYVYMSVHAKVPSRWKKNSFDAESSFVQQKIRSIYATPASFQ